MMNQLRPEDGESSAKGRSVRLSDLVRSRRGGGFDHLVAGGEDCHAGTLKDSQGGGTHGSGHRCDAGVDEGVRRNEEVTGGMVAAFLVNETPLDSCLRREADAAALTRDLLVGQDRVAVGGQAGPRHYLPAVPRSEGIRTRCPGGMISGDRKAGRFFQVCFPEADAIHHDAVIGWEWSIRTQFAGEDAPMSLLKRDLLGSKDGEMSQGDRFRSIGSDEWIHELLPVHKE